MKERKGEGGRWGMGATTETISENRTQRERKKQNHGKRWAEIQESSSRQQATNPLGAGNTDPKEEGENRS